jgi:hypothetical protein
MVYHAPSSRKSPNLTFTMACQKLVRLTLIYPITPSTVVTAPRKTAMPLQIAADLLSLADSFTAAWRIPALATAFMMCCSAASLKSLLEPLPVNPGKKLDPASVASLVEAPFFSLEPDKIKLFSGEKPRSSHICRAIRFDFEFPVLLVDSGCVLARPGRWKDRRWCERSSPTMARDAP